MRLLPNDEIALRWYEIQPKVKAALEHGLGENSPHDLFLECMAGAGQIWEHKDLIAMTRFIQYPRYKQLHLVTLEGHFFTSDWEECLEMLEKFGRDTGCKNLSIWGRPGWEKILTHYKKSYTVLNKEL